VGLLVSNGRLLMVRDYVHLLADCVLNLSSGPKCDSLCLLHFFHFLSQSNFSALVGRQEGHLGL